MILNHFRAIYENKTLPTKQTLVFLFNGKIIIGNLINWSNVVLKIFVFVIVGWFGQSRS